MADHVWTHIKIGGAIDPEGIDALPAEFSCSTAFHPVMYLKEIRERLADGSLARSLDQIEIWSGEKDFPVLKLIEGATDDASS